LKTGPPDLLLPTGHLSYRHTYLTMKTYHAICHRCARGVNFRRAIRRGADLILFIGLVVGVLVAVPTTVFAIGLLFFAPDTFRVFGPAAVIAIFFLWLVVWSSARVREWAVPATVRDVGRTAFDLISATTVPGGLANAAASHP